MHQTDVFELVWKLNIFLISPSYKLLSGVAQFLLGVEPILNSVKRDKMANKKLRKMILVVVILDILMLLFDYGIIQFGAFCLGMKTSEIVYSRTTDITPAGSLSGSSPQQNQRNPGKSKSPLPSVPPKQSSKRTLPSKAGSK